MNYLHVCWLCSSEFHFALAFDVVVAASCFLLRIQKHLSREILPHTLEVKRSSRSQPDLIFCSNILSSGHHSSQLAISYKIQYHIQQQQHSQNHQVINHKRIFALFPLYSPNIQDTSESQYSFKASILTAHSMTKSSIFATNLRPISKFCSYTLLHDCTCICITSPSSIYTSNRSN